MAYKKRHLGRNKNDQRTKESVIEGDQELSDALRDPVGKTLGRCRNIANWSHEESRGDALIEERNAFIEQSGRDTQIPSGRKGPKRTLQQL